VLQAVRAGSVKWEREQLLDLFANGQQESEFFGLQKYPLICNEAFPFAARAIASVSPGPSLRSGVLPAKSERTHIQSLGQPVLPTDLQMQEGRQDRGSVKSLELAIAMIPTNCLQVRLRCIDGSSGTQRLSHELEGCYI
jgi:hypothetical protein